MKIFSKLTLAIVFLLFTFNCSLPTLYAAIPHLINYQGKLTDSTSKPVSDGTHSVTFRIFDVQSGGSPLWEETQSLTTQKGIFNVLLGGVTALNLAFDKPYWLEIKVESEVLTPRQQITSSGYAIRAEKAEQASNADTISNIGVSSTPAANKIVPLDNNAKLPSGALKVYDSGWFAVTAQSTYTKTHNLGTNKLLVTLYYADDASGNGMFQVIATVRIESGAALYISQIQAITPTTLQVQTGAITVATKVDPTGNYDLTKHSGYLRVIALALE